ncbi:polysaccharide deacetylase family protein [Actinomycetospora sp. TBRC 11914]|uniref:polysaccharide deacetylase family protein n=1 Tax=Actinomycetospora sp. TBRC 11914 TaxID=2729387 RepID=UPI00145EC88B|nr:polysaccharide deacetylase family protein [Actinomycetospora sp. TBRC 11914]NMO92391.1 polysaccharide deacetylase family protein [Actinomycetospora sp. TBRC 11914]
MSPREPGPATGAPEPRSPGQNDPAPAGRRSGRPARPLLAVAVVLAVVAVSVAAVALVAGTAPAVGTARVAPGASAPGASAPDASAPGVASASPAAFPRAAGGSTPLVVSLTFDDGLAGQMQYLPTLRQNGLAGTFYINTGAVGQPNYMTRADLTQVAAAGNEIGGHSVSHPNLPLDAPDETARQICDDRATLTSWGFDPVSFAYPFGMASPAVEAAVRDCGYTSGRLDHGVGPTSAACPACTSAEGLPPADPYALRTPPDIVQTTTLADLEAFVTAAQSSGGGWVPFIFHHESCDNCGTLSTSPVLLDQFAAWLAAQQRAGTLVVRTVGQTVGQTVGGRAGPPHTAPAATATSIPDGQLTTGSGVVPDCWEPTGYGQNVADFRYTPAGPAGPPYETVTVSSYTNGDATMLPRLDLGQCTVTTSPGTQTHLAAQYRSSVPTQFVVYRRTGTGSWEYWTASPFVGPAADWAPIAWDTPPAPPDTTGVAAGLAVGAVGWVQSTAYTEAAVPAPSLISPGLRGVLELGAVVAAALGLLGAVIGLAHHYLRRRRPGGRGEAPAVPEPRPAWGPWETGEDTSDARGDDESTVRSPDAEREDVAR